MSYIDGFAFPIASDRLEAYRAVAEPIAEIWIELGALAYYEHAGDDLSLEGTRSFVEALAVGDDETIVFGWIMFESREARDLIHDKVSKDPRVEALMSSDDSGFDPSRMAWGGFKPLISLPGSAPGQNPDD